MFHVLILASLKIKTLKQAFLLFHDNLKMMIVAVMIMIKNITITK